jgi:hypothetical protein
MDVHFYYHSERGFGMYPRCPKCKGTGRINRHLRNKAKTCSYCQGDGSAPLCGLCALPTCEDFACQPKINLEIRQRDQRFDGLRYTNQTGPFPGQPFTIIGLDIMEIEALLWIVEMPDGRRFRTSHYGLVHSLWQEDVTLC